MLRVWHRAGAQDRPWVGRLEHLPEGTVWTFDNPQAMLAEVLRLLEPSARPATGGTRCHDTAVSGPSQLDTRALAACANEREEGIG
jgi:hypothetical protein